MHGQIKRSHIEIQVWCIPEKRDTNKINVSCMHPWEQVYVAIIYIVKLKYFYLWFVLLVSKWCFSAHLWCTEGLFSYIYVVSYNMGTSSKLAICLIIYRYVYTYVPSIIKSAALWALSIHNTYQATLSCPC